MSAQPDMQPELLDWGPEIHVDLPGRLREGPQPVATSFSETSEERIMRITHGFVTAHLRELEKLANRIILFNPRINFAAALGQAAQSYEDPPDASDVQTTNNYPNYHET